MPKDTRTFITVHDGMPEHPKVEALSDAAFRLLVECWCYCSRNLTDGQITAGAWQRRGSRKARAELLAAGLVEETAAGVEMHDYTEHQRTASEVADLKAKRADAGRKGGKAKASARASASDPPQQELDGLSSKPVAETETDTEEDQELTSEVADAPSRPDVIEILDYLDSKLLANDPEAKLPVRTRKNTDAGRLLLDRDGKTVNQVKACIDFATGHEFWRSNIRSMSKLREQYDRLRLQAQRLPATVHQFPPRNPDIDWDAAMNRAAQRDQENHA